VKLVMFTDVNDVELYVNPNLVTFIREASVTSITLDRLPPTPVLPR
jgi:hypothetical protein